VRLTDLIYLEIAIVCLIHEELISFLLTLKIGVQVRKEKEKKREEKEREEKKKRKVKNSFFFLVAPPIPWIAE